MRTVTRQPGRSRRAPEDVRSTTGVTSSGRQAPILYLQRTIGNQAVQRLLRETGESPAIWSIAPGSTSGAHERSVGRRFLAGSGRPVQLRGGSASSTVTFNVYNEPPVAVTDVYEIVDAGPFAPNPGEETWDWGQACDSAIYS